MHARVDAGRTRQDLAATSQAVAQPTEIAEPIRALLQTDATVVMRGATRLEFWWVKNIPLDTAPAAHPSWSNVPDGALVGAVRLGKAMSDIRGGPMKPGVYTLRFALQPQNGDHMGVSPYREFLLVAPAADDQSRRPGRVQGRGCAREEDPRQVASLRRWPRSADDRRASGPVMTNDDGHKGVVFTVP